MRGVTTLTTEQLGQLCDHDNVSHRAEPDEQGCYVISHTVASRASIAHLSARSGLYLPLCGDARPMADVLADVGRPRASAV